MHQTRRNETPSRKKRRELYAYNLTGIDYSDTTPDVTFTYDSIGNRLTMSDGTGTTSYSYDDLYRLTTVTDGASLSVGYSYDAVGNRTGLTYPDSKQVTYSYDDGNRLDSVTDWNNGQFGYNYDDANRLTGLALPNGVSSSYSYDDAGRLSLLAHTTLTDTLASYSYALDEVGNRRVLTESLITVPDIAAGTYLESDGLVVMEAENGSRTDGATQNWLLLTSQTGYTGTSYAQSSSDVDALYQTNTLTDSPRLDFPVNVTNAATYTVWLRGYAPNAAGDSIYLALEDQTAEALTGFAPHQWDWGNRTASGGVATIMISTPGLHTIRLWQREDGLRLDRIVLTTDSGYIPSGSGPFESNRHGSD